MENQGATVGSQGLAEGESNLTIILLGTAGGPTFSAQRHGISTLVLAGPEKLLFDCGHGMTAGMSALAINPADITKVFLTHQHLDHDALKQFSPVMKYAGKFGHVRVNRQHANDDGVLLCLPRRVVRIDPRLRNT